MRDDRAVDIDPDSLRKAAAREHSRQEWIKAAEKMMVYQFCWEQVRSGESTTKAMKHMAKNYKKSLHGTTESEALLDMKKEAEKKKKAERQKLRDEYIDEERANKVARRRCNEPEERPGQRRQREQPGAGSGTRHQDVKQMDMTYRRKADEVFRPCPPSLQGKYVSVSRRPVFRNPNKDLSVSAGRGYKRDRPCEGVCRECGKSGHEAFECKADYDYNGMTCVPPAKLFADNLVDKTGVVQ